MGVLFTVHGIDKFSTGSSALDDFQYARYSAQYNTNHISQRSGARALQLPGTRLLVVASVATERLGVSG